MSHATPSPDPLSTAQSLTDALTGMSERLDKVAGREKNTRRIAWGLVVSVVLDVVLTVVLAGVAVQAHTASNRASAASMRAGHASASNLALCRAGNVARGQQLGIWVYLLHLTGGGKTPEARALVMRFEDHLKVVFAKRDCATLGTKKP